MTLLSSSRRGQGAKIDSLKELKNRLLFVFLVIVVYRIGAHVPVPGLNPDRLADLFSHQSGGILGLLNLFSGGALLRLTIFALGIMPYISASIIMQLFAAVSPALEQLKKEGEVGRRKLNQYTRYGTLLLSVVQALGMSKLLASQGIALYTGIGFYFFTTLTLVTGTMFLMWLGEQATERGIGNGISIIIFASIVSRFPAAVAQIFDQVREGQMQVLVLFLIMAVVLGVIAFVVFFEKGQRRITVNYAQQGMGKVSLYGRTQRTSHLPLKINMAGVIPPIFASSIIILPATLFRFFSANGATSGGMSWLGQVSLMLSPGHPLYVFLFASAIVFFSFFYTSLVFNPRDTAENLKKSGAFLPGIRPGDQTAKYIDGVMTRLTLVGAAYLVLVSLLPEIMVYAWHIPFYFGGTSLLIIVVVVMDFVAQVQAQLISRQYESLIRKANAKGYGI